MKTEQLSGLDRLILGALALHPEYFRAIRETLRPDMFSGDAGRVLAAAMWPGLSRGRYIPEVVKAEVLPILFSMLDEARKRAMSSGVTPEDVIQAAGILYENWANDRYEKALQDVAMSAGTWQEKNDILEAARQEIAGVKRMAPKSREEVLDGIIADMFEGITGKKTHCGIGTGFADLDDLTGGWEPGQQVVIGGRPGMGKTRFALGQVLQAARDGNPCAVFSMEMTAEELYKVALSWMTKIPVSAIRTYNYRSAADADMVAECARALKGWPLYVVDNLRYFEDIEYALREMTQRYGLRIAAVDYLQLIYQRNGKRNGNRNNELTEISAGFKGMAQELRLTTFILSQLNREVDKRANRKPVLADLRDSGAIEADADVVVFPYRLEPDAPESTSAEIIVAKQRAGRTGAIECEFTRSGFYAEAAQVNGHAQPIAPAYVRDGEEIPF